MLRQHLSFAKREERFADLFAAFAKIKPLAQHAIQKWIYLDLSRPDPRFSHHAQIDECPNSIRVSLLDLLGNGASLNCLHFELAAFNDKEDSILRLLSETIASARSNSDLSSLVTSESKTLSSSRGSYVYRHIFNDGRLYIGKGSGGRAQNFVERNPYYLRTLKECGPPLVLYVKDRLTEHDAYRLENSLISSISPVNSLSPGILLNSTHGFEKAPIGEMPIKTALKLFPDWPPKWLPNRYRSRIHLYRRFFEDVGSPREYEYDIPIHQAAIMVECSMNELLVESASQLPKKVGNYWIMTKEQIAAERLKP